MSCVDQLKASLKNFESVQLRYATYGAVDTEPSAIMQGLLARAVSGSQPRVPYDGNGWELYTASMDCDNVARELGDAAQAAVDIILNTSVSELQTLRKYLKDYCWRCPSLIGGEW
jgi:hypothetical protein